MHTSMGAVGWRLSRLLLSIGVLACAISAADAATETPEFGRFRAALVARDEQVALAFIAAFPSSPLVEDLIEMLPRLVAQGVCADLPSGAARAQDACRKSNIPVGAHDLWGDPIVTDDSDVAPTERQASEEGSSESGIGDADIAPMAGPAAPTKARANARARPAGTTGEREIGAVVAIPPILEQNAAVDEEDDKPTTTSTRKEAAATPKARRDRALPAPRLGGDPGSDPGAASSPSSHGGDPGSDPGSGAGGEAGRDSHN
jgi:hypothetical protein